MSLDLILAIVSRWLHVAAAVVAVGGTAFVYFVLVPAETSEVPAAFLDRVRQRFRRVIHIAIGLLLLTGLYNYLVVAIPAVQNWEPAARRALYHALIGSKITLALALFLIAILLLKPLPAMQSHRKMWLGVNLVLGALILLLGALLRRLWAAPTL
ncbi:MAG: hypothetical protein HY320_11485 [Armatimonadetes bacterium]|nr:hypothetical protein [Armatimonadota bacterium]